MRLVVDTNVFVSAALKEASWPGAVTRWLDMFGGLLKSIATEQQVIEVLQRPYFAPRLAPLYLFLTSIRVPALTHWPSIKSLYSILILSQNQASSSRCKCRN